MQNNKKSPLSEEQREHKKTIRKIRLISAIVTAAILLTVIVGALIAMSSYGRHMENGEALRGEIAASSKNFTVDGAMMNYYFNDTYNTFKGYYGSYTSYLGLDTEKSLKTQYMSDGESWFDYFMEGSRAMVTKLLTLNEAATVAGVSLNDSESAALLRRVDRYSENEFGKGVSKDDIQRSKLLEALAHKYQAIKEAEFEPNDEEITARYGEAPEKYQSIDVYAYSIAYSEDGRTESEAKTLADRLAAAKSPEEFRSTVGELLKLDYPEASDESIDAALDSIVNTGVAYSEGNELIELLFDLDKGDTYIKADSENSMYSVYLVTAAPYLNESDTVTVRHILLNDKTYGGGAKEKATELLDTFNSGDKTIEEFALLALEYSDDDGSYYNGGLYENVYRGQMVEEFEAWCFDGTRSAGDTGIVETEYGTHIMYFVGAGKTKWEADVCYDIVNERFSAYLDEAAGVYPSLFDETVIDMIPG